MINNITSYFREDGTPTEEGLRYFNGLERSLFGVGQSWQDVTGSRAHTTSYRNETSRPIQVVIGATTTARTVQVSADNSTWIAVGIVGDAAAGVTVAASFIVPPGNYYRVNGSTTIVAWSELR